MNLTKEFKSSPSAYIHHIAARMAGRLWWLLAVPLCVMIYGAAADWRWIVVGLMILFIIYPMIITLVILRYAAMPVIARRATANQLRFEAGDGIVALRADYSDDDVVIVELEHYKIQDAELHRDNIIVRTGPALSDFLIIPRSALSEQQLQYLATKQPVYTDR